MKTIMYCCRKDGEYQIDTLSIRRKWSIAILMKDSSLTWHEVTKYRWQCVKVELTLTEIK